MRTIAEQITTLEPMSFLLGLAVGVVGLSFILIWAAIKRRGEWSINSQNSTHQHQNPKIDVLTKLDLEKGARNLLELEIYVWAIIFRWLKR